MFKERNTGWASIQADTQGFSVSISIGKEIWYHAISNIVPEIILRILKFRFDGYSINLVLVSITRSDLCCPVCLDMIMQKCHTDFFSFLRVYRGLCHFLLFALLFPQYIVQNGRLKLTTLRNCLKTWFEFSTKLFTSKSLSTQEKGR